MPESGIATLTSVAGLDVTLSEGVLSVTIDRPDSLNSVTTPVLAGIADAMEQAATDPRVEVVRLRGAGRGFCSGAGMSADDVAGDKVARRPSAQQPWALQPSHSLGLSRKEPRAYWAPASATQRERMRQLTVETALRPTSPRVSGLRPVREASGSGPPAASP